MRDNAITVKPVTGLTLVDTCGTGGDGAQTFNISTTAALVAAGAGCPGRQAWQRGYEQRVWFGRCPEALGGKSGSRSGGAGRDSKTRGIAFFFAPIYHPAMRHVVTARQEIGCRTVFNILGPLSNPAGAQAQGPWSIPARPRRNTGRCTQDARAPSAMVVHGSGLDEITTTGETVIADSVVGCPEVHHPFAIRSVIAPANSRISQVANAHYNARIIREVLKGEHGAARDIVLLNAAAAIYVGGRAGNLHEGNPVCCFFDRFRKALLPDSTHW